MPEAQEDTLLRPSQLRALNVKTNILTQSPKTVKRVGKLTNVQLCRVNKIRFSKRAFHSTFFDVKNPRASVIKGPAEKQGNQCAQARFILERKWDF